MDRLLDAAASRGLDRYTLDQGKLGETTLMRNAGRAVAIEAAKLLQGDTEARSIIVCGKGHNGGDGLAAAGYLTEWGYDCRVVFSASADDLDPVVGEFYRPDVLNLAPADEAAELLRDGAALVVDALLGIGVEGALRDPVAGWVDAINDQPGAVLSIDLPSGLSADNGRVWDRAVRADLTVTMGYAKLGLWVNTGPDIAGHIVVADIGFDGAYFDGVEKGHFRFITDDFAELYVPPLRRTYKQQQGKTLVIAGSRGMTGAAAMTAGATLLSGAGLTVAACPLSLQPTYATAQPEIITLGLEDHGQGLFLPEHVSLVQESLEWCTAVILGPGLSRSPQTLEFARQLVDHLEVAAVLDADGLKPFNGQVDPLNAAKQPLVLTPHVAEFADLFDHDLKEVIADPIGALHEVRSYFHQTVVLKGAPTLVLLSSGEIVVNSTGNPGMATAGAGDVLSGVIGTFLSQGYSANDAALLGVWLHGRAADLAAAQAGLPGITSTHIMSHLPHALAPFGVSP